MLYYFSSFPFPPLSLHFSPQSHLLSPQFPTQIYSLLPLHLFYFLFIRVNYIFLVLTSPSPLLSLSVFLPLYFLYSVFLCRSPLCIINFFIPLNSYHRVTPHPPLSSLLFFSCILYINYFYLFLSIPMSPFSPHFQSPFIALLLYCFLLSSCLSHCMRPFYFPPYHQFFFPAFLLLSLPSTPLLPIPLSLSTPLFLPTRSLHPFFTAYFPLHIPLSFIIILLTLFLSSASSSNLSPFLFLQPPSHNHENHHEGDTKRGLISVVTLPRGLSAD